MTRIDPGPIIKNLLRCARLNEQDAKRLSPMYGEGARAVAGEQRRIINILRMAARSAASERKEW
jgi:hypothetical protein